METVHAVAAGSVVDKVSHTERKAAELVLQTPVAVHLEVAETVGLLERIVIEVGLAEVGIAGVEADFGIAERDVVPRVAGKLERFGSEGSFELIFELVVIDSDARAVLVGSLACIGRVDCFGSRVQREVCC